MSRRSSSNIELRNLVLMSTVAATEMMHWETGHKQIIRKSTFHSHAFLLPFFFIEWASKILSGQVCHLAYLRD